MEAVFIFLAILGVALVGAGLFYNMLDMRRHEAAALARSRPDRWTSSRTTVNSAPTEPAPPPPTSPPAGAAWDRRQTGHHLSEEDRDWLRAAIRDAIAEALGQTDDVEVKSTDEPPRPPSGSKTHSIMEWLDGKPILDRRPSDQDKP